MAGSHAYNLTFSLWALFADKSVVLHFNSFFRLYCISIGHVLTVVKGRQICWGLIQILPKKDTSVSLTFKKNFAISKKCLWWTCLYQHSHIILINFADARLFILPDHILDRNNKFYTNALSARQATLSFLSTWWPKIYWSEKLSWIWNIVISCKFPQPSSQWCVAIICGTTRLH